MAIRESTHASRERQYADRERQRSDEEIKTQKKRIEDLEIQMTRLQQQFEEQKAAANGKSWLAKQFIRSFAM